MVLFSDGQKQTSIRKRRSTMYLPETGSLHTHPERGLSNQVTRKPAPS